MASDNSTIFSKLLDLLELRGNNPGVFTDSEKVLLDLLGDRPEKHGFTESEKKQISDLWEYTPQNISDDLITSDNHEFQIGDSVGLLDHDGAVYHVIGFNGDRPIIQQAAFQTDKKNLWLRWAK